MAYHTLYGAAILFVVLCLSGGDAIAGTSPPKSKPLVAAVWVKVWASGAREVVIEPDVKKLRARGLTIDQLAKAVRGRRFVSGNWTVTIDKAELDLAAVAKLTVRDLQSPPFTVKLRDGREVVIAPRPKRIGHYVVTGEYFEQDVRDALADFSGPDPGKVNVLAMIPVPGTVVPHFTEEGSLRHISAGESLETFAKVEVRNGPNRPASDASTPAAR